MALSICGNYLFIFYLFVFLPARGKNEKKMGTVEDFREKGLAAMEKNCVGEYRITLFQDRLSAPERQMLLQILKIRLILTKLSEKINRYSILHLSP